MRHTDPSEYVRREQSVCPRQPATVEPATVGVGWQVGWEKLFCAMPEGGWSHASGAIHVWLTLLKPLKKLSENESFPFLEGQFFILICLPFFAAPSHKFLWPVLSNSLKEIHMLKSSLAAKPFVLILLQDNWYYTPRVGLSEKKGQGSRVTASPQQCYPESHQPEPKPRCSKLLRGPRIKAGAETFQGNSAHVSQKVSWAWGTLPMAVSNLITWAMMFSFSPSPYIIW